MEFTNTIDTLELIGQLVRDQYRGQLKKNGNISTGKLYNSIGYKIEVTDTGVNLYFLALDYYIYIENGRKSGKFPPINVIKKWMVSKGIPESNNTAYVIARKISKKGIPAKPYLRNIKKELPSFTDDITKAIEKDLEDYLNKNLTLNK